VVDAAAVCRAAADSRASRAHMSIQRRSNIAFAQVVDVLHPGRASVPKVRAISRR
jgi:hypothetical protein